MITKSQDLPLTAFTPNDMEHVQKLAKTAADFEVVVTLIKMLSSHPDPLVVHAITQLKDRCLQPWVSQTSLTNTLRATVPDNYDLILSESRVEQTIGASRYADVQIEGLTHQEAVKIKVSKDEKGVPSWSAHLLQSGTITVGEMTVTRHSMGMERSASAPLKPGDVIKIGLNHITCHLRDEDSPPATQ